MTPVSSISRMPSGWYELKIRGRFHHPHWIAHLFSAMAKLEISIQSGRASQVQKREWDAQFVLDFSGSKANPDLLDYGVMAQQSGPGSPHQPKLGKYKIVRRADQQLEILLEGPDQIGFLGSLLGKLSLLALFPAELEINTINTRIKDRVVLRGLGDEPPTPSTEQSLDTMMRGYLIPE